MYFEQFYLGCLAHASYLFGSGDEAVIVDPQRDIEIYLHAAAQHGLKIRHIFETHLHADFVSGHKELAAKTGATIYLGAEAGAKFPHVAVQDGMQFHVGNLTITALETPGHTPESICLSVDDPERSVHPALVFTGDTLFVGDVGRPDLSKTHTPQQLAGLLFDSLNQKLMKLPDATQVFPAHGAGSLCGRNMRAERSSTIGNERLTNYALQIKSRDVFIRQMTTNLPARPEYFALDADINRTGAPALDELPPTAPLSASAVQELTVKGAVLLDVRNGDAFAAAHLPGSVNIGLGGQFASWAATVLGLDVQIVLIAEKAEQISEARTRLARVGMEKVAGYLENGVEGWQSAGLPVSSIRQITATELSQQRDLHILDVRREGEWNAGHIPGARWHALDDFRANLPELNSSPTAVLCKGGYRSITACSLLEKAGAKNVINLIGGFDAWQAAKLPVETKTTEVCRG